MICFKIKKGKKNLQNHKDTEKDESGEKYDQHEEQH